MAPRPRMCAYISKHLFPLLFVFCIPVASVYSKTPYFRMFTHCFLDLERSPPLSPTPLSSELLGLPSDLSLKLSLAGGFPVSQ